ncbi:poly (ADP-ribose) polymerase, putative [Bodo saltans]|uniref:Poly [ADP-ribose] polymerase n=1 Tax=Bodo saltans TaxID=75058 RepID=A0A0S4JF48_BODSA|nr:poly (ADP-ribose) polymerase, putative [Bodo saltans]|eukprot:CUG88670.1 poly (ADP-ribose) polymerase, putative [Bodo saltans]
MAPKKKLRGEEEKKLPALTWQWFDGAGWTDFLDADAAILEKEQQAGNAQFTTSAMSFSISSSTAYDLVKGTQTNTATNVVRKIRRLTLGVWEYVDDHGMFVALYDDDNVLVERLWRELPHEGGQFNTKALSWNKGYNSQYTFVLGVNVDGTVNGTQKNEDSGNVRVIRRIPPPLKVAWDTKGYGISGMSVADVASTAVPPAAAPVAAAPETASSAPGVVAPAPLPPALVTAAVSLEVFAPPPTWQTQASPYQEFSVSEGTSEYINATTEFIKTLKNKVKIHSVTRIQNLPLWRFYALTRHRIALRNKGDAGERNLFHGARVRENMNAIMQFGFDMRVARDGSAGIGIYFAVNSSYSNAGYVLQNPDKSKEMFVCRVAIGSCVQGKHGMKRPPNKTGASKDEYHDSVHNGLNIMFIVFDNSQAYPEYLIKYTNLTGY